MMAVAARRHDFGRGNNSGWLAVNWRAFKDICEGLGTYI